MKLALLGVICLLINLIVAFPQNNAAQTQKCSDMEFHRCVQSWRCQSGQDSSNSESDSPHNLGLSPRGVISGQSMDCSIEDSAQDKVCCIEDHILHVCEDFFDKEFSCVKEETCEMDVDIDIRQLEDDYFYADGVSETMALAEESFCHASGDNPNVDPRTSDPRTSKLSYPETGYFCCHKEKILNAGIREEEDPTLHSDSPDFENCETFSDIGFSCVPRNVCETKGVTERNEELRFALAEESSCEETPDSPTEKVCCHQDSIKIENNLCENHSDIGFSCVKKDLCNRHVQSVRRTVGFGSPFGEDVANTQKALADEAICNEPTEVCCSKSDARKRPEDSTFGEWPNTCLLFKKGTDTFIGGASLLTPNSVLTAAHKIDDINPDGISVRCGEWDLTSEQTNELEQNEHQDRLAKSISIHTRFTGSRRLYNDVAVIHLKVPFDLSMNIQPISLPESAESYDATDCVVTGWGNQGARIMKRINISLVENNRCQDLIRATPQKSNKFRLDKSFVCAGGEEGKDVCEGDGGGPLVCNLKTKDKFVQVGIIAWGVSCGKKNVPGVYASVPHALDFIAWDNNCHYGGKYSNHIDFPQYNNWIDQEIMDLKAIPGAGKLIRRGLELKRQCI